MIYLDNAATTFPKPEVVYTEMDYVNRTLAVNAGRGSYKVARQASDIVSELRTNILRLFDAEGKASVVLTPSVTHALNQILSGLDLSEQSVIYISYYEHNAVVRVLELLKDKIGFSIEYIPVFQDLRIDLESLDFKFAQKKPDYVVMSSISNVTGYILPTKDVFQKAKEYGAITISDASQAAGLIPIKFDELNADIICFAGHKTVYGPFGIAGFVIKDGINLSLNFAGGTGSDSLNKKMPSGTPGRYEAASKNIIAIAGLNASLKNLDVAEHFRRVRELTDILISRLEELSKIELKGCYKNGDTLGIVSFTVDGYDSNDVGSILDEEFDIAVRTGYHCAPDIHELLDDIDSNGTIRVGIGMFNTIDDISALISALESL